MFSWLVADKKFGFFFTKMINISWKTLWRPSVFHYQTKVPHDLNNMFSFCSSKLLTEEIQVSFKSQLSVRRKQTSSIKIYLNGSTMKRLLFLEKYLHITYEPDT